MGRAFLSNILQRALISAVTNGSLDSQPSSRFCTSLEVLLLLQGDVCYVYFLDGLKNKE